MQTLIAGRSSRVLALLLTGALVGGCVASGPKNISMEEAQKVALKFARKKAFDPPPRNADDIVKDVKETVWGDYERCPECVENVDKSSSPTEQARILGLRGRDAYYGGHYELAVKSLTEARRFGDPRWLAYLAKAQFGAGRLSDAIEIGQEASHRAVSRTTRIGRAHLQNVEIQILMLRLHLAAGNLSSAAGALADMSRSNDIVQQYNRSENFRAMSNGYLAAGQARMLDVEGRGEEAMAYFRKALSILGEVGWGAQGDANDLACLIRTEWVVESLVKRGRLIEAEFEGRRGFRQCLAYFGRQSVMTARGLISLGRLFLTQDRPGDGEKMARTALSVFDEMKVPPAASGRARAKALLAESLMAKGDWNAALEVYREIASDLAGEEKGRGMILGGNLNYALTLLMKGETARAEPIVRGALDRSLSMVGEAHYQTVEAKAALAVVQARNGDRAGALAAFDTLFPAMVKGALQGESGGAAPGAHRARLGMIVEFYLDLLTGGGNPSRDAMERAFQAAQLAQGAGVQKAVAESAARARIDDPKLAKLVRQAQDARQQMKNLLGQLSKSIAQGAAEKKIAPLREEVTRLRAARVALLDAIRKEYPEYDALIRPTPVTLAAVSRELKPGEAFFFPYLGSRMAYLWAAPHGGAPAFAAVDRPRERYEEQISRLRFSLNPNVEYLDEIPRFDAATAHDLYRHLLAPVEKGWREAEVILAAPQGRLASLPLATLVTRPPAPLRPGKVPFAEYRGLPWLGASHAFAYLPSVASLATLRRLPPGDPQRLAFLGFGDPWFEEPDEDEDEVAAVAPTTRGLFKRRALRVSEKGDLDKVKEGVSFLEMLSRLPETAREVEEVYQALGGVQPGRDLFLGRRATEAQVSGMGLKNRRIVMFATHALVAGDLDGLEEPAIALASPDIDDTEGDGLLTMSEVLALKMDADWVVLSACNTGAADGRGAEAVSGLGMSFFYAGARALLVTHWPVETHSAQQLTTDLFHRYAGESGLSRAAALKEAMNHVRTAGRAIDPKTGKTLYAFAHPVFWAPFTLVGEGG